LQTKTVAGAPGRTDSGHGDQRRIDTSGEVPNYQTVEERRMIKITLRTLELFPAFGSGRVVTGAHYDRDDHCGAGAV
jgi:hypothetical protein